MNKVDRACVSTLGIIFIIGLLFLLAGCSTVETKTAEYCETNTEKFWFIPITRQSDCAGMSVEGSNGEITLPIGGEPDA